MFTSWNVCVCRSVVEMKRKVRRDFTMCVSVQKGLISFSFITKNSFSRH